MKNYFSTFLIAVLVLLLNACNSKKKQSKNTNSPTPEVSYFGQKPPGMTPEIFAPEIVSVTGRYEYALSFSPTMDELYFSGNKKDENQTVYFSKLKDKKWSQPKKANFTKGQKKNEFEAFVSPDNKRIYFSTYDSIFHDENIWYVDRLKDSWSEAKKLDSPMNDDIVFYANAANNGDIFYTSISKLKMYYAPNKNGAFPEVHEIKIEHGGHGYISPNQDFLLVDAKKDNDKTKDRDIHVYFKKKNGEWTKPINLGSTVNSDFTETCPSLSPDGKYLFFSRYNEENRVSNIYWVSADVIDKVKPTDLNE
ncbi:hypothetical protein [Tenacibaculum aiptasiae]|uniref:hypothetical protein n=1 Tax=Tenacibaculum aiptasiae TaxID=426481 RepID=UPI0023305E7D|nr:hypothetical protein [Tenacibaculum aiptasiae]